MEHITTLKIEMDIGQGLERILPHATLPTEYLEGFLEALHMVNAMPNKLEITLTIERRKGA